LHKRRGILVRKLTILAALASIAIPTLATTAQAETGIASYYPGRGKTGGMTCAHKTAPFGTQFRVVRLDGRGSIVCRVNDRGPYTRGFIIDVSISAARALGIIRSGITRVRLERV
jgi:rare lipoprotein A